MSDLYNVLDLEDAVNKFNEHYKKNFPCGIELSETVVHIYSVDDHRLNIIWLTAKYSLQGTTQGRYLTGGVPPVRFSM